MRSSGPDSGTHELPEEGELSQTVGPQDLSTDALGEPERIAKGSLSRQMPSHAADRKSANQEPGNGPVHQRSYGES
jgi:hypothetical protein